MMVYFWIVILGVALVNVVFSASNIMSEQERKAKERELMDNVSKIAIKVEDDDKE